MDYQHLKGKIALITGALRGMGRGIALVLAEQGADIIINDVKFTQGEMENLLNELKAFQVKVEVVKADVSNRNEVKKMFTAIQSAYGKLDILVNNAGTSQNKDIFEIEEEDWNYILDTN